MGSIYLVKDALHILLHTRGISKKELAENTNIPVKKIDLILSGRNSSPNVSILNELSNYLGVSVDALAGNEEISGAEQFIFSEKPKNTSEVLKHLMLLLRHSESSLARATTISQPILHRVINEKDAEPSFKTLAMLAAYFNISIDQITAREEINYDRLRDSFFKKVPILNLSMISKIEQLDKLVKEWSENVEVFGAEKLDFCIEITTTHYSPNFYIGDKLVFSRDKIQTLKDLDVVVAEVKDEKSYNKKVEIFEVASVDESSEFICLNNEKLVDPYLFDEVNVLGKMYKVIVRNSDSSG